MTAKDLKNIRVECQNLVKGYLERTGKSQTQLAKESGIHPAQLLLFMKGDRGLTDTSLSKLGAIIEAEK
jgi:plasmid maintenance system antidote protein VapI